MFSRRRIIFALICIAVCVAMIVLLIWFNAGPVRTIS